MKRSPFPLVLTLIASGALHAAAPAAKPNFLIILADDMGYSDLGCYGGEIATPNLDRLAAAGLRFTQFYNTARCWPTRGALMTGYYAQPIRRDWIERGDGGGGRGIRPAWAPLLSATLKPLGYRAYHSGKWHIDGQPLENGFDRDYSINDHNRYFHPQQHTEDDRNLPPVPPDSGFYLTTHIADHAIKCLQEHAAKYAAQPFFEYLCFTSPHFPLHALAEDIAKYRNHYNRGWDLLRRERWERMRKLGIGVGTLSGIEREVGPPYHFPDDLQKLGPDEINRPVAWSELSPAQRDFQVNKMAIHAAMVDRMDREIGRVLEQVRRMGALENTVVFFLSDNGASAEMMVRGDGHDPKRPPGSADTFLSIGPGWSSLANTPFRRHKTWVHEGGIATSFIVHWPMGVRAKGELRHTPGHVIDLAPTILEVAGAKPLPPPPAKDGPPLPGRSLVPAFANDVTVARDSIWFLHEGNRALRAGDWKIVAAGSEGPWELYDLGNDRAETMDLAARNPDKVRELAALWSRQTEEYRAWAKKDAPPRPATKGPRRKKGAP